MRQGWRADTLESGARRLGCVNRRRRREALVGRRASELLDDVPEIVLVDIVDRRLMLLLLLLRLRLRLLLDLWLRCWLRLWVIMIETLTLTMRIKRVFFDDWLGDLVGELIEVSEVLVSACIITSSGSAAASRSSRRNSSGSGGRVCRGLAAFIHHTTTRGGTFSIRVSL